MTGSAAGSFAACCWCRCSWSCSSCCCKNCKKRSNSSVLRTCPCLKTSVFTWFWSFSEQHAWYLWCFLPVGVLKQRYLQVFFGYCCFKFVWYDLAFQSFHRFLLHFVHATWGLRSGRYQNKARLHIFQRFNIFFFSKFSARRNQTCWVFWKNAPHKTWQTPAISSSARCSTDNTKNASTMVFTSFPVNDF